MDLPTTELIPIIAHPLFCKNLAKERSWSEAVLLVQKGNTQAHVITPYTLPAHISTNSLILLTMLIHSYACSFLSCAPPPPFFSNKSRVSNSLSLLSSNKIHHYHILHKLRVSLFEPISISITVWTPIAITGTRITIQISSISRYICLILFNFVFVSFFGWIWSVFCWIVAWLIQFSEN